MRPGLRALDVFRSLGFRSDTFNEVVLTIWSGEVINSSPIGILYRGGRFYARVYPGSTTHDLLLRGVDGSTLCVTRDPFIFYYSVLEKERLKYIVLDDKYHCIDGCSVCVVSVLERLARGRKYLRVWFKPLKTVIRGDRFYVFHRCDYALVEALIYYTKIPYVDRVVAEKYLDYMVQLRETIYRSTYSRKYREAIDLLVEEAEDIIESKQ